MLNLNHLRNFWGWFFCEIIGSRYNTILDELNLTGRRNHIFQQFIDNLE